MKNSIKALIRLCVVTNVTIMVMCLGFSKSANATEYLGGNVCLNGYQPGGPATECVGVDKLNIQPGGFTNNQCNVGSNGFIQIHTIAPGQDYINGQAIFYDKGQMRCQLTVTRKEGPTKYNVNT
jgi:hypothetical protein